MKIMKFKLIKTSEEYHQAIAYLEILGDREDFQENEGLMAEFELLSTLIGLYEKKNFPIAKGHPIDIIKLKMNYLGLKRKDLSHIASSGVLSEVFNKKRGLSKNMIRQFSELLDIEQHLLNSSPEEEGYIADELQPDVNKQTARKCLVISQTVKNGDFTLDEALQLYRVPGHVYTKYAAQAMISELDAKVGDAKSKKEDLLFKGKVLLEIYKMIFSKIDNQMPEVEEHYKHLFTSIKKNKVIA